MKAEAKIVSAFFFALSRCSHGALSPCLLGRDAQAERAATIQQSRENQKPFIFTTCPSRIKAV